MAALARLFKALGDPVRVRILGLLAHGELCVCHIEAALGISQSNTSRHLAILRAAGVVAPRRDKRWVHYALARLPDGPAQRQLDALVRAFAREPELARAARRARSRCE